MLVVTIPRCLEHARSTWWPHCRCIVPFSPSGGGACCSLLWRSRRLTATQIFLPTTLVVRVEQSVERMCARVLQTYIGYIIHPTTIITRLFWLLLILILPALYCAVVLCSYYHLYCISSLHYQGCESVLTKSVIVISYHIFSRCKMHVFRLGLRASGNHTGKLRPYR